MKRLLSICAFLFIIILVSGCAGRTIGDTEETESDQILQSETDGYITEEDEENISCICWEKR